MPTRTITIEIHRENRASGQSISAVASAPSRRILGVVDILVPLMPGYSIAQRVGQSEENAIIDAAKALALRIAEAVETEGSQG